MVRPDLWRRCSAEVNRMVEVGANRVSALAPGASIDQSIASLIDHTLLKADAAYEDIERFVMKRSRYGFASVCINRLWSHWPAAF